MTIAVILWTQESWITRAEPSMISYTGYGLVEGNEYDKETQ